MPIVVQRWAMLLTASSEANPTRSTPNECFCVLNAAVVLTAACILYVARLLLEVDLEVEVHTFRFTSFCKFRPTRRGTPGIASSSVAVTTSDYYFTVLLLQAVLSEDCARWLRTTCTSKLGLGSLPVGMR